MSNLYSCHTYKANINCLIDCLITEYDITKANISILLDKGVINEDTYYTLYNSEKLQREIYIGKLLGRNPKLSSILSDGIIDAKRIFFQKNSIEDKDVLEIDNDSIYLINRPIIDDGFRHVSPHVYFRLDHIYTSFYQVNNIRFYYYLDRMREIPIEELTPKGLGKGRELHENFMLDFLKELFYTAQCNGVKSAIELLSIFYKRYINRELPIEYYRSLNSQSMFHVRITPNDQYLYMIDGDPVNFGIKGIDISYNEKLLRKFNTLLFAEYANGKR